jgi:DNA-binding PadR family transcriptional regulator
MLKLEYAPAMSSTRLLVLGVVRILQPVHGYEVRRELRSWQLEDWANIQVGSVYSALKTLEKDGLIAATPATSEGGRPARTEYVLTTEGEKEFLTLLRTAWWRHEPAVEPLVPGLSLMPFLSRAELLAALKARTGQVEGRLAELRLVRATIRDGATGEDGDIPEHCREMFDFMTSRLDAELDWARGFEKRLRDGAYHFADDADAKSHAGVADQT